MEFIGMYVGKLFLEFLAKTTFQLCAIILINECTFANNHNIVIMVNGYLINANEIMKEVTSFYKSSKLYTLPVDSTLFFITTLPLYRSQRLSTDSVSDSGGSSTSSSGVSSDSNIEEGTPESTPVDLM